MKPDWSRSRPYVCSIGGHLLVLAFLCFYGARLPAPLASGAPGANPVSAIEATLVGTPKPAPSTPAASPAPPSPVTPPPQPPSLPPAAPVPLTRPIPPVPPPATAPDPATAVATRPEPDRVDALAPPLANDASGAASDESAAQALQASAATQAGGSAQASEAPADPYAEMRRLRAQAERQHQLDEQNLARMQAQARPVAITQWAPAPPAQALPTLSNGQDGLWSSVPPSASLLLQVGGGWNLNGSLPLSRCSHAGFQGSDEGWGTPERIDCLLSVPGENSDPPSGWEWGQITIPLSSLVQ